MRKTKRKTENTFSADMLMHQIMHNMIRDFQSNYDDPLLFQDLDRAVLSQDPAAIRAATPAVDLSSGDASLFKATYQMASMNKRHRYQHDIYSEEELMNEAIAKFKGTQLRISAIDLDMIGIKTDTVLSLAKICIARVLGKYDDEEHRLLCRMGKKASVGVPARMACEAAKWELPLSGSQHQIEWFDSEMSLIPAVQDYWQLQKSRAIAEKRPLETYHPVDSLKLTFVPKSYKSLRAIVPNTTIGSYMTYGLGEMMRRRLKSKAGLNISRLQDEHKILAQRGSVHGQNVTLDLSSASDSISVELVNRLLPDDWCRILHLSRIGKMVLPDGSLCEVNTFCTMGIGYTFCLQTLIFWALLKAIEATLFDRRDKRYISVYGDDMIFSVRMYEEVVYYFNKIGFQINEEKSFATGNFRESCGGDYFRGLDVRPFQPKNGSAALSPKGYEAMLYKCINGLLMRWSEHEIGRTLSYLVSEIERVTGKAKLVPFDYPDDSGIKCSSRTDWVFLQSANVAALKHMGHGLYRFPYLRLVPEYREEVRHEPYYWAAMRGHFHRLDTWSSEAMSRELASGIVRLINSLTCPVDNPPLLITLTLKCKGSKAEPKCRQSRSELSTPHRRNATCVTIGHTGSYQRRYGVSLFGTRS